MIYTVIEFWRKHLMLNRIAAIILLLICGSVAGPAQTPATPGVWNVTLPEGLIITSAVNVTNKCRNNARLKLESKDLKFLILPSEPVDVPGEQTIAVPAQFDTKNLKPGKYEGSLTVMCVSCGGDSGCAASREDRRLVLTVTPSMGTPQTTHAAEFNTKPLPNGEASAPFSRTVSPTVAALREFLKGPCPERESNCDSLRRDAEALAEKAKLLSAKASKLQESAAIARKNADTLNKEDRTPNAVEIRRKASSAEQESASGITEAKKAREESEAALSEYKKCLSRIQEECRKKN